MLLHPSADTAPLCLCQNLVKPEHILIDACDIEDRCNPNPCEHGGVCTQTSLEFVCDCSDTGYTGAVCHAGGWRGDGDEGHARGARPGGESLGWTGRLGVVGGQRHGKDCSRLKLCRSCMGDLSVGACPP